MGTSTESTDFTVTPGKWGVGTYQQIGYSQFWESIAVLLPLPVDSGRVNSPPPWWKRKSWLFVILAIQETFMPPGASTGKTIRWWPPVTTPEGMDPAMAGYLIDDTAKKQRDLVSL